MSLPVHRLRDIATSIGIAVEDLVSLLSLGQSRSYQSGDFLFHESSHFTHFVRSLVYVKMAAARANKELGVLRPDRADAIVAASEEIIAGKWHAHFTIDMIQGGAGTSTNMNANEAIANRALEILGHRKGQYEHLHPNDDVNCSQSTNDAYPTAIKLGVILTLRDATSALGELREALDAKAAEFADVLKMGRTENQDAVPMTLGQEFSAYAVQRLRPCPRQGLADHGSARRTPQARENDTVPVALTRLWRPHCVPLGRIPVSVGPRGAQPCSRRTCFRRRALPAPPPLLGPFWCGGIRRFGSGVIGQRGRSGGAMG